MDVGFQVDKVSFLCSVEGDGSEQSWRTSPRRLHA